MQTRKAAGLSLRDFAARLGTSAGRISEIESGKSIPGGDLLVRVYSEFAVDLTWLLTGATTAGEVPVPSLKPDEAALLDNYRNSPEAGKAAIKTTSAAFAQSSALKKKAG